MSSISIKIPDGCKCYITEQNDPNNINAGIKEIERCPFLEHGRRTCSQVVKCNTTYFYGGEKISTYCNHFKCNIEGNHKCDECMNLE